MGAGAGLGYVTLVLALLMLRRSIGESQMQRSLYCLVASPLSRHNCILGLAFFCFPETRPLERANCGCGPEDIHPH
jgi:hypothetical protein